MTILIILLILVFVGNAFLFSGALTGDLANNSIAVIIVLLAVVADIAFIYWIIKGITKRVSEAQQQRKRAKANAIKAEIDRTIGTYCLPNAPIFSHPLVKDGLKVEQYDQRVLELVNSHWNNTEALRRSLAELFKQNTALLACPNCYSDEDKLQYLRDITPQLELQKANFSSLVAKCDELRIAIPYSDEKAMALLRNALRRVRNSRKTLGMDIVIDSTDPSKLPMEMKCFKYNSTPITLTIIPFVFCLLPNVILVFRDGRFLTAVTPVELRINAYPVEEQAIYKSGKYSSQIVDSDSKRIQAGTPLRTWLHTRKNGAPDLRYSYNPSSEYRIDRMAYGKIQFEIAGLSAACCFSSYEALGIVIDAAKQYCVAAVSVSDSGAPSLTKTRSFDQPSRLPERIKLYKSAFASCKSPDAIIDKYVKMGNPDTLTKAIEIEVLRYYLQHNSAFITSTWTFEKVLGMVEEALGNKTPLQMASITAAPSSADSDTLVAAVVEHKTENIESHAIPDQQSSIRDKTWIEEKHESEQMPLPVFCVDEVPTSEERHFAPEAIAYPNRQPITVNTVVTCRLFDKMRKIGISSDDRFSVNGISISISGGTGNAAQFAAQAKYMADYTDDYTGHADFQCYYATYDNMNDEQLHTYFTWRTKIRNGQVEKTDLSYAFVYIYELLNLVGVKSVDEGLYQLLTFWTSYRNFDEKIDAYLQRWIKEFFVYYRINGSYRDISEQFPAEIPRESMAQAEVFKHNYSNKSEFLNRLSSHKFLKSKYYESELGYTLIECIPLVLARVDTYLGEHGISFPKLLLGSVVTSDYWRPFNGAVVDIKDPPDNYTVRISDLEEYSFSNGRWHSQTLQNNYYSNLLGYIIKTTEAELRELTGYKRKLQPNIGSLMYDSINNKQALAIMNQPAFTAFIRDTVRSYFADSGIRPLAFKVSAQNAEIPIKPREVTVDISKLAAIRTAAMGIQDRLVVEEPQEERMDIQSNIGTAVSSNRIEEAQQVETLQKNATPNALSVLQRTYISILISRENVNPRIAELTKINGILPEVLMESVNDLLFETFGDNVIDASVDTPYIYDDYVGEVKTLIEED